MNKKYLVLGAVFALVLVGAGCSKNKNGSGGTGQNGDENWTPKSITPEVYDDSDQIFEDKSTKVSFHYQGYLQKSDVQAASGTVKITFKRRDGSTRPIDTLIFSAKTKQAYLAEKKLAPKNLVCENYDTPGCDKWEDDQVLYNRAISQNNYDGYYGFGGNKVTVNGITFVDVVSYNLERQQYQSKYVAFVNDTRITFVDPATGGLEYGVPFQMNARNREMIEKTGQKIAKREKIDDQRTLDRAKALYDVVASTKIIK